MKSSQVHEAAASAHYNSVEIPENVIGTVTLTVETQIVQPIFKGSESIGQTIDFMISEFYAGNPEGKLSQIHLSLGEK